MNNQNAPKMYSMFDVANQYGDIWYIENVLSYPDELIEFINLLVSEDIEDQRISKWSPWTASDDASTTYGLSKTIYSEKFETPLLNEDLQRKTLYIRNSLRMAAEMSMDRYFAGRGLDKNSYKFNESNYYVKKWQTGSMMGPHKDENYSEGNLAFSIVIYLNDNYEGGEINFPEKAVTIKPAPGSAVIFPSNMMHQVLEIKSGDRYMSPKHMYKI
jgi:hypothetical protein